MYSLITNPKTGRRVSIRGRRGKQILRNYMNVLSGGSAWAPRPPPPPPIKYNGQNIRLCCSNTRPVVPVTDKIPIPIIYVRAHGVTDSFERTGVPLVDEALVVINSNSFPTSSERNGKLGRVTDITDGVYTITSPADTIGYDGEGYGGLDFLATKKQIMPYFEYPPPYAAIGPLRYLEYGTNVRDSSGNKGVIVSNFDSETGEFKVLFGQLSDTETAAPETPLPVHHTDLTPISATPFTIPDKTYIITFSDVGDQCLLDYQVGEGKTIEDRLIEKVLRPFMTERQNPSDELTDIEIAYLRNHLEVFTSQNRGRQIDRQIHLKTLDIETLIWKDNFKLHTPGSQMFDTWLDFKEGCAILGVTGEVNVCDITCINTISMLTNYETNRCTNYSDDMYRNKFHNSNNLISLRELIRNHGHGIYILSSCRSFVPGTDPRKGSPRPGAPASLARQLSAERGGLFWDKRNTLEELTEATAAIAEHRDAARRDADREAARQDAAASAEATTATIVAFFADAVAAGYSEAAMLRTFGSNVSDIAPVVRAKLVYYRATSTSGTDAEIDNWVVGKYQTALAEAVDQEKLAAASAASAEATMATIVAFFADAVAAGFSEAAMLRTFGSNMSYIAPVVRANIVYYRAASASDTDAQIDNWLVGKYQTALAEAVDQEKLAAAGDM